MIMMDVPGLCLNSPDGLRATSLLTYSQIHDNVIISKHALKKDTAIAGHGCCYALLVNQVYRYLVSYAWYDVFLTLVAPMV